VPAVVLLILSLASLCRVLAHSPNRYRDRYRSSFSLPAWFFSQLTRKVFAPDSDFDVLSQLSAVQANRQRLGLNHGLGH